MPGPCDSLVALRARAATVCVLALSSCASVDPQRASRVDPLGLEGPTKPVDFTLARFPDGAPYRLSSDRGSVVLLEVWATWCDACRDSLPFADELHRELAGRGLRVYALSIDADARQIPGFLEGAKVTVPILHDPEGRLAERELHVRTMPTSFLVDRRGSIRAVREGWDQGRVKSLVGQVTALLEEPAK